MVVTWGQNQVFNIGGAAPASAFGAPAAPAAAPAAFSSFSSAPSPAAAAPTGGFGTTPTPASTTGTSSFGSTTAPTPAVPATNYFGAPNPAPPFGSSTTAPSSSTGFFGSTTPAPATSSVFFGSTTPAPAPATTTGFFGTAAAAPGPAPFSAFSSSAAAAAGPQIPAEAAMRAHMDASAKQEAAKLETALGTYHRAYDPKSTAATDTLKFVTIVYSDISPQQHQLQQMQGRPLLPPKPPTVSEEKWLEAVVANPDPDRYMPEALVGAVALQTRVAWQQNRADSYAKNLRGLQAARATLQQRCSRVETDLQRLDRIQTALRTRLLSIMRKVELARCMNLPLQQDEETLKRKLVETSKQVDQLSKLLSAAQVKANGHVQDDAAVPVVNVPEERELTRVLKGHREALTNMTKVMEKDKRDLSLLQHHVVPQVPLPPH